MILKCLSSALLQAVKQTELVNKPQNSVGGAAGLQRDGVTHFVSYVDVHFISHAQGQIYGLLSVGLCAHNHAVLVLRRQTELCTPLRDLKKNNH